MNKIKERTFRQPGVFTEKNSNNKKNILFSQFIAILCSQDKA